MSNHNNRNFKQIIKTEKITILIFTLITLSLPVLIELMVISDIVRFDSLKPLAKLGVIVGLVQFSVTNLNGLWWLMIIFSMISLPYLVIVGKNRLDGSNYITALYNGFTELTKNRTWNYILKIYLPIWVMEIAILLILIFIPDKLIVRISLQILSSQLAFMAVTVLSMVILMVIGIIMNTLFVSFIIYLQSDGRIKEAISVVPQEDKTKILIFNFISSLTLAILNICFYLIITNMKPMTLISDAIPMTIAFLGLIIVHQIIFTSGRYVLLLNVASNVTSSGLQASYIFNSGTESYISTNNEQLQNNFEGSKQAPSIQPKRSRNKGRDKQDILKKKPKRTIK